MSTRGRKGDVGKVTSSYNTVARCRTDWAVVGYILSNGYSGTSYQLYFALSFQLVQPALLKLTRGKLGYYE